MSPSGRARGPRDLSGDDMLAAAVALMEERGEAGFSLRRVAAAVGCDPMSVTYHFGSREGLTRGMAAWLDEQVTAPAPGDPWRARLDHVAQQYRGLALRHPRTFPLLQRFTHSGPADHALAEVVHRALAEGGVPEPWLPTICLGWYGCVIGLAVGEVSGLVAPVDDDEAQAMLALPDDGYALTRRLVPAYRELAPEVVFDLTLEAFVDGIAARSWPAGPRAGSSSG